MNEAPPLSLDFRGRTAALLVSEIAERLGYSPKHIYQLVEQGELIALDGKTKGADKPSWRVPIESYRNFIVRRMNGTTRADFLATLPEYTLRELVAECTRLLKEAPPGQAPVDRSASP